MVAEGVVGVEEEEAPRPAGGAVPAAEEADMAARPSSIHPEVVPQICVGAGPLSFVGNAWRGPGGPPRREVEDVFVRSILGRSAWRTKGRGVAAIAVAALTGPGDRSDPNMVCLCAGGASACACAIVV